MMSEVAYFACGCFWGAQYYFAKSPGVLNTVVGYMGGHKENPTYKEVCTKTTGHLETTEVTYDPTKITYENLVKYFFEIHDFSQENGQGPDIGPQYLSAVFVRNDEERSTVNKVIDLLKSKNLKVATKVLDYVPFYKAEDYHQLYYEHKGESPYCHIHKKIF